eukprot:6206548-Pleurochrysis_carterae.AAC.6
MYLLLNRDKSEQSNALPSAVRSYLTGLLEGADDCRVISVDESAPLSIIKHYPFKRLVARQRGTTSEVGEFVWNQMRGGLPARKHDINTTWPCCPCSRAQSCMSVLARNALVKQFSNVPTPSQQQHEVQPVKRSSLRDTDRPSTSFNQILRYEIAVWDQGCSQQSVQIFRIMSAATTIFHVVRVRLRPPCRSRSRQAIER